jgi:hypothetical protein
MRFFLGKYRNLRQNAIFPRKISQFVPKRRFFIGKSQLAQKMRLFIGVSQARMIRVNRYDLHARKQHVLEGGPDLPAKGGQTVDILGNPREYHNLTKNALFSKIYQFKSKVRVSLENISIYTKSDSSSENRNLHRGCDSSLENAAIYTKNAIFH